MGFKSSTESRSSRTLSRLWFGLAIAVGALGGCNPSDESHAPSSEAQSTPRAPQPAQQSAGTAHPPPAPPSLPHPSGPPLNAAESLVAPVALYPDPLLSELLIASTYPVEIVQAARWLEANPDLASLKDQDWDPSVQRIAQVPEVLKMMNQHLDWMTALGNAFLENPDQVLAAVQTLRGKAVESGFLTDTPQQKVDRKAVNVRAPAARFTPAVQKQDLVTIQPAKEDTLYVPQYSPEAAYSAPLAAPPGSSGATYPATTAYPTPSQPAYYPTYAPTAAATETSTTNPWLTFGAGALVGGLVTWGIMELADDDDWDDGYWGGGYYRGPVRVVHHYGDAVCYRGNCWNGGGYRGNGYRGDVDIDRGDINLNRQVNVSGNRISNDRTFRMNDLKPIDQVWRHDSRHRRGQRYTEKAKMRIGDRRTPDLAGSRLSGLNGMRDGDRGTLADRKPGESLTTPGTLPSKGPLSSEDVRAKLADREAEGRLEGARERLAERDRKGQDELARATKDRAFSGAHQRGSEIRQQAQRGKESRQIAMGSGPVKKRADSGGGAGSVAERVKPPERKGGALAQRASSGDAAARQQRIDQVRRSESVQPSAFGGARDGNRARNFSQRGAASRQSLQAHRASRPAADGAGGFNRGGGGHVRGGDGGRLRGR